MTIVNFFVLTFAMIARPTLEQLSALPALERNMQWNKFSFQGLVTYDLHGLTDKQKELCLARKASCGTVACMIGGQMEPRSFRGDRKTCSPAALLFLSSFASFENMATSSSKTANTRLPTHLESDWLYQKNFASFDVPVPGWPPGDPATGNSELPGETSNGSTGEEVEIDEELAAELRLPARRLRGIHSRASPRASKACEGCRK